MNPADLVERLKRHALGSADEDTMRRWDGIRAYFKEGDRGASHPRDCFESIIDCYAEDCAAAADEIERLRKINTKLQRDLSDRISDIFEHDAEIERLRAARDVALEEAAKVAWEHDDDVGAVIADAIRALKEQIHEPG